MTAIALNGPLLSAITFKFATPRRITAAICEPRRVVVSIFQDYATRVGDETVTWYSIPLPTPIRPGQYLYVDAPDVIVRVWER